MGQLTVTTAYVIDHQGALQTFKLCKSNLSQVSRVLTDTGYTGKPFAQEVREILNEHVNVQVAKRSELQVFKAKPQRWAECSFAWLNVAFRWIARRLYKLAQNLSRNEQRIAIFIAAIIRDFTPVQSSG